MNAPADTPCKAGLIGTSQFSAEQRPEPAIASTDPLRLFRRDGDGLASTDKARIRIALAGGQFLASLLVQNGADHSIPGGHTLTACPEWTGGIGAALSAVLHSIEAACDGAEHMQQLAAQGMGAHGGEA